MEVQKLASLSDTLTEVNDESWADPVEIQRERRGSGLGWMGQERGRFSPQMRLPLSAKTLVTPCHPEVIVPARELLGEMLLELNEPAEAMVEFEATESSSPNRFNSLSGAARAASCRR